MKEIFKHIISFLLSLRTAMWLLGITLALFFAGALIMPGKEEFETIHSSPMFEWLTQQPLKITWWLWILIAVLSILTINTIFCSVESITRKKKVTQWMLLISPQIIHAGFLFILLAHLLTAKGGFQSFAVAGEGSFLNIPGSSTVLQVRGIDIYANPSGYITGWEVKVEYLTNGVAVYSDIIKPNQPSIRKGFNINVKDLAPLPHKAVLLQVNREPGAFFALAGGVLFMIGMVILIVLKIRVDG